MDITSREVSGVTVMSLRGPLDTGSAPEVGAALEGLAEGHEAKIVVDLTGVDYVSSAGLRVLLATAKQLRGTGGDLAVCGLNPTVQQVFDMSGFSSILKVFGGADAAASSL